MRSLSFVPFALVFLTRLTVFGAPFSLFKRDSSATTSTSPQASADSDLSDAVNQGLITLNVDFLDSEDFQTLEGMVLSDPTSGEKTYLEQLGAILLQASTRTVSLNDAESLILSLPDAQQRDIISVAIANYGSDDQMSFLTSGGSGASPDDSSSTDSDQGSLEVPTTSTPGSSTVDESEDDQDNDDVGGTTVLTSSNSPASTHKAAHSSATATATSAVGSITPYVLNPKKPSDLTKSSATSTSIPRSTPTISSSSSTPTSTLCTTQPTGTNATLEIYFCCMDKSDANALVQKMETENIPQDQITQTEKQIAVLTYPGWVNPDWCPSQSALTMTGASTSATKSTGTSTSTTSNSAPSASEAPPPGLGA